MSRAEQPAALHQEWTKRIEQWQTTDKNVWAQCQEQHVSDHGIRYWLRKFKGEQALTSAVSRSAPMVKKARPM